VGTGLATGDAAVVADLVGLGTGTGDVVLAARGLSCCA
jgi:hypothetical protein